MMMFGRPSAIRFGMVTNQVRGFGGAIVKADGDHKFIAPCNKKMVAFTGMQATSPTMIELDNPYRHLKDLPLNHHQHIFSAYPGGHDFEEETRIHDEPYGYELGDDPFDPNGNGDYPALLLFVGIISFVHFSWAHFRFDKRRMGEVLYHQRLTSLQIEDEIRARRQ